MAKSLLVFIFGLIIGGILVYLLLHYSIITNINSVISTNTNSNIVNSQVSYNQSIIQACENNVNQNLGILENKIPSSTSINIVNVSVFKKGANINNWLATWSYVGLPMNSGYPESFTCEQGTDIYFCNDLQNLEQNSSMSLGIAVSVKAAVQNYGGHPVTFLIPVLCGVSNTKVQLMPQSSLFLINGDLYFLN
ncbi:MAG: hypothetical protein M1158_04055 [Candidatus Marsarchaeota archaeon]|nr:hypothetical protein [Candidatus Marsarchaeota archaeon]